MKTRNRDLASEDLSPAGREAEATRLPQQGHGQWVCLNAVKRPSRWAAEEVVPIQIHGALFTRLPSRMFTAGQGPRKRETDSVDGPRTSALVVPSSHLEGLVDTPEGALRRRLQRFCLGLVVHGEPVTDVELVALALQLDEKQGVGELGDA